MTRFFVVAVTVLLLLANTSQAQVAESWKEPQVGDSFIFRVTRSNGEIVDGVRTYLGKDDKGHRFANYSEKDGELASHSYLDDEGNALSIIYTKESHRNISFEPNNGQLSFPLSVDKQWEHTYKVNAPQSNFYQTRKVKVVTYEQLRTQAGLFGAYRLESEVRRWDNNSIFYETYWYSPEINWIIKGASPTYKTQNELISLKKKN